MGPLNTPYNPIVSVVLNFLPIPRQHSNTPGLQLAQRSTNLDKEKPNGAECARNEAPPPSRLRGIGEGE
jgi:hypothetical protein